MPIDQLDIASDVPGQRQRLAVHRFGRPGGLKATIQAAMHADETPGMLVAHQLSVRLRALDAAGALRGEVLLVPCANPIGLGQRVLGQPHGRFDLRDGVNFNRQFVDLAQTVADRVGSRLGLNAADNRALIRTALREAAASLPATHPAADLKRQLLALAIDSDIVLDLHCDGEAAMHLYTLTPHAALGNELGARLGARAVLLCDDSGDGPFDEACSRPWLSLRSRFEDRPIPLGCFAATVELRGESDTSHRWADQDAGAIIDFLRARGLVAGEPASAPAPLCAPTPLASSEPVIAPRAGVVVFLQEPGAYVEAGAVVADIVDVETGAIEPVCCRSSGVLYARMTGRWAVAGDRLAKIAGTVLQRSGKLLSP